VSQNFVKFQRPIGKLSLLCDRTELPSSKAGPALLSRNTALLAANCRFAALAATAEILHQEVPRRVTNAHDQ
jgi:hypothetical protein